MTNRLKILYVLGRGRSGSTFVENALAQRSGLALLGESRLWPLCYNDQHLCSCGKVKTDCAFWAPALQTLPDRAANEAAFRRMIKRKFLLSMLLPKPLVRRVYGPEIAALGQFYSHLAKSNELQTVIDSSKNPAFGRMLSLAEGIDVQFVHVVRNPLGVAYSWKRQLGGNSDAALHQQRKSLAMAALEWAGSNLLSEVAKFQVKGPHRTLRYEGLGNAAALDGLVPTAAHRTEQHAMSGNPSAQSRQQEFQLDEDWRQGLSLWEKAITYLISGPLMAFYAVRK